MRVRAVTQRRRPEHTGARGGGRQSRGVAARRARRALVVLAVLVVGGAALAGCQATGQSGLSPSPLPATASPPSRVAPLFPYGEGLARAGGGEDEGQPLREAAARQIVDSEARRNGLTFVHDALPAIDEFVLPGISLDPGATLAAAPAVISLRADGMDRARDIIYEVVTKEDVDVWATRRSGSAVSVYHMRGVADQLQQALATRQPPGTYVVFYDPVARGDDPAAARGESEEQLRAQVRSFVAWLRTQAAAEGRA